MSDSEARISLDEYVVNVHKCCELVIPGAPGSFWHGVGCALMRRPDFCLDPPDPQAIRKVLWRNAPPLASYVCRPGDAPYVQNAWLYLCENQNYCFGDLSSPARRDIRRALRSFRFEFVEPREFLVLGVKAFCDTRKRIGFSDGVPGELPKEIRPLRGEPRESSGRGLGW